MVQVKMVAVWVFLLVSTAVLTEGKQYVSLHFHSTNNCTCFMHESSYIVHPIWVIDGVDTLGDTIIVRMCDHSLQLELWTGHRGVHPLGTEWTVSTLVPFPTLRCCEGEMEGIDEMGCLAPVDHKDRRDMLEQQALRISLVQGVVGWPTQGGEKWTVQVPQELSCCMQEGLVEPSTTTREEQPTTSACPMIQTTSTIACDQWQIP